MRLNLPVVIFISILLFLHSSAFVHSEENYPQRIVSLGPALTEEIYLLGVEDRLVGCTIYCQRPPKAKNKEKVGTAIEVNLEKIVVLKPDLVLATSLTDPKAKEKLKKLGIRVITFPEAKSFDEICQHFLELGRIVSREKEAQELINIAKKRVNSIIKKVKGLRKPRVFVQVGAKPLVAVSKDSFVNDFIKLAGGINSVQGSGHIRYSREKVLKDNPDVIIIVTMGINGEEEKRTWQKYKTLNATKFNKIYIIDPDKITSPTPLIFTETLEEIAMFLHPNLEGR
jgi:iron complex transport system substrate-binding protein